MVTVVMVVIKNGDGGGDETGQEGGNENAGGGDGGDGIGDGDGDDVLSPPTSGDLGPRQYISGDKAAKEPTLLCSWRHKSQTERGPQRRSCRIHTQGR